MNKLLISFLVLSIIVVLTSYRAANRINEEILTTLGYDKSKAEEYIMGSVVSGLPWLIKPNNLPRIISMSSVDKTALTKDFCAYIKSYIYSQEFKDKYEAYRQSKKPQIQQFTEEEKSIQKELIAQQEEMYTPEVLEMLPPESRAAVLQSIEDMKASSKGGLSQTQLAEWEKEVPLDPYVNLKKGLKTFLDDTKDVDYNATTYVKDGKNIFTNPEYEEKNGYWKLCYRAGKDVSDVGRNFAKDWMAELN